ncbi:MAG TPA: HAD-IA family hydrolase [Thermoanaerobaculia bacterium]|jgi:putative hydrolase of the HAD superfamily|nr:HAD-IA family hydrolase [Thermoanaerobaculia bacterium]
MTTMTETTEITHLFTDLGGVLLTNGWDRGLRQLVASHFGIDPGEMDERHHLTYDTYEAGKISLSEYLRRVVFWEPRGFSEQQVVDFMLEQARCFPDMIEMYKRIKARHGLRVVVVSNEGRELTQDRIRRFKLKEFVDIFVVSSYVHFRKPDEDIFRIALDVAQAEPAQVVYVDDRHMFAEVASRLGMIEIWHRDYASTRAALGELGLEIPGGEEKS